MPESTLDWCHDCGEPAGGAHLLHCPHMRARPATVLDDAPPPSLGDPRFHALLAELSRLHVRKATDYGRGCDVFANVRASEEFGIPAWRGALVRLNDKVHRLKSYCLNGSLANEGVADSLMDLAAYSLIALILFRETEGR